MAVPSRTRRRPLLLEALEPRVYLSGRNTPRDSTANAASAGLRAIAESLLGTQLSMAADVESLHQDSSGNAILVVDVNGNADLNDALLGRFDYVTGELIESVPINNGQLVLIADESHPFASSADRWLGNDEAAGSSDFDLTPFDLAGGDQRNGASTTYQGQSVEGSANSSRDPDRATVTSPYTGLSSDPHGTPAELIGQDEGGGIHFGGHSPAIVANDLANTVAEPPRGGNREVFVVFPTGIIPDRFDATAALPSDAGDDPPAARDPNRPLVLSPGFPQWYQGLGSSIWWSRAFHSPGLQARYAELFDRGLMDELNRNGLRPLLSNSHMNDPLRSTSAGSSRVMLRTPAPMIAFTTPGQNGTDRSGASELAVYDLGTGQLRRTGQTVTGRLLAAGNQIAFLSSESDQGVDMSGDGLLNATVLQVFNPVTGGVRNTGIRAESVRAEAGSLILGIRQAARVLPAPHGQAIASKLFAFQYDTRNGRLTNLERTYDSFDEIMVQITHRNNSRDVEPIEGSDNNPSGSRVKAEQSTRDFILDANALPLGSDANRSWPVRIDVNHRISSSESAAPPNPAGPPESGAGPNPTNASTDPAADNGSAGGSAGDAGAGGE